MMGKGFRLHRANFLLLLIAFLATFLLSKIEFPKIDAFVRDILQLTNNTAITTKLITVNFNTSNPQLSRPISLLSLKSLVEKIEQNSPRSITLLLEPSEIKENANEAKEFVNYLNSRENIFLSTSTSRPGKLSFKDHLILGKVRNLFSPPIATVDENFGPKDQKRRRTTIAFEKNKAEIFEEIKKIGIEPKSPADFKFPVHIWNTTQVYFKTFKVGTFGNVSSDDIDSYITTNTFVGKQVLIGAFDEFSFFSKPSIFDFFERPTANNFSESYFPYHEYIANVLYLFESGDYIKYGEVPDLFFLFVSFVILIFANLKLNLKLILLLSLIPILFLFQLFLYIGFDIYINFSRSFALLLLLHVFFVPILFFFSFSNLEKAKILEINRAKIFALESVSEKLAHDIRSPLSTTKLLLSKAKFERNEHKEMIQLSILRIEEMTQEILNKGRRQVDQLNVNVLIKRVVLEKQSLHPNIFAPPDDSSAFFCKVERTDLERVLSNVLDNSISACSKVDGRIEVSIKSNKNELEIIIADNGSGIDEALLKNLGKSRVQSTKAYGNGVGLFHSKNIIEDYGGRLLISSAKSKGTVVSIILPIVAG